MNTFSFPEASSWSLYLGNFARACIFITTFLMLFTSICLFKYKLNIFRFYLAGSIFLTLGITCLAILFATDQFQYDYVFKHSDLHTPFIYKIAAVWSGQEGSFFLWSLCSAWFGTFSIKHTGIYQRWYGIVYSLFLALLTSILLYESPFILNQVGTKILVPVTGLGLQPTLINPWIVIHPPVIFAGFASLNVLYCWALSALLTKDTQSWIVPIRPWAILSITLLGIGLSMGGLWAYETLGWGGFWAWDPVENSSFIPWILTVGFLHGVFVQNSQKKWAYRNILTAAAAFLSFLYGTFLTRSGILADTSVHSFAQMDRNALKILVSISLLFFILFIITWFWSFFKHRSQVVNTQEHGWNRESGYGATLYLTNIIAALTAWGMSVPLYKSLLGQPAAIVEAHVYHKILVWFFVPFMLVLGINPLLTWKRENEKFIWARIASLFILSLFFTGLLGSYFVFSSSKYKLHTLDPIKGWFNYLIPPFPWILFLCWLCIFSLLANMSKLYPILRKNLSKAGGYLSHVGVILLLFGLMISKGFEKSERAFIQKGHPAHALGYWIQFKGFDKNPFDRSNHLKLELIKGKEVIQAKAGFYFAQQISKPEPTPVSWPFIQRRGLDDLYLNVGAPIYEATDIILLKEGKNVLFNQLLIGYDKMHRMGEAGIKGTKFQAHVQVKSSSGTKKVVPSIEITENGLAFHPVRINDDYLLYLQGIDAKDNSAKLQLYYLNPVYPIEIFFKPMVQFVWIGMVVLLIGGTLSTLLRFKNLKSSS